MNENIFARIISLVLEKAKIKQNDKRRSQDEREAFNLKKYSLLPLAKYLAGKIAEKKKREIQGKYKRRILEETKEKKRKRSRIMAKIVFLFHAKSLCYVCFCV